MHKILLVIQREYLVRVRQKSFIVMTILAPLLMAANVYFMRAEAALDGYSSENAIDMLDYFMNYNGSLDDYNNTYDSNTNLTYHNLTYPKKNQIHAYHELKIDLE